MNFFVKLLENQNDSLIKQIALMNSITCIIALAQHMNNLDGMNKRSINMIQHSVMHYCSVNNTN